MHVFRATGRRMASSLHRGNVVNSFDEAVGNTDLIRLRAVSEATGCNVYGKAEYQNPGGSIKDRAALSMILDAEERGVLKPGKPGIIVEGTAGNTGIGLALAGNSRGYKTVICIAASQSEEKKNMLRWAGASLVEVPAVPYKNPNNYVHVAERLAQKLAAESGEPVFYANQWDNLANRNAHIKWTGPEICDQLDGKVHGFSCAMGTGGTLTGTAEYLRSACPGIKIGLTDPRGAAIYRYFTEGVLKSEGDSISEGIGQGRLTGNMADFKPDLCYEISDEEALPLLFDMLEHEGLLMGSSSAINVAGAYRVAKELGPGHNVVTMLCDLGNRYASKIYNVDFLRTRTLPIPKWLEPSKFQKELQKTTESVLE